jgi:isoquinoline 1-oxidoreductase beta subunit
VEDGTILSPFGKKLTFGEVADAASRLPVPENVTLKDAGAFKLIGTAAKRLDTPLKVDGRAQYGIDVRLPDMLYAALAQPPTLGGKVKSIDDSAAKALPGYKATVQTSSGVAVVADSWFRARKARDALKIEWDNGPNAALNDAAIMQGACRKRQAVRGRLHARMATSTPP